jgi:MoaA/NifB/PqqE/SkfB family radical SAM enzyme
MTERKHLCVAPWVSMHLWPNNNVYPCCAVNPADSFGQLDESGIAIMNNEKFKKFRIDILADKKLDVCKTCWKAEEAGQVSLRKSYNHQFLDHAQELIDSTQEDGTADVKMLNWDFRSSNLCNYACRTCGPQLSSTYKQLSDRASGIKSDKVTHIRSASEIGLNQIIEQNTNQVKAMHFAGGEPLLMEDHYKIINKLIEENRTDVNIQYSTNGSKLTYKSFDFRDAWHKFDCVTMNFSIDEIEDRAEYWRYGTDWSVVKKNIDEMMIYTKEHTNVCVWFAPTISVFNIARLEDIHKYFREAGWLDGARPEILFNLLHTQEYYCVKNTSDEFKQYAKIKLESYVEYLKKSKFEFDNNLVSSAEGLISFMMQPGQDLSDQLTISTELLDFQRNENIFDVAPELAELLINKTLYDKQSITRKN